MSLSVLTIAEIRAVEEAANAAGYAYEQMMEDAGTAAAERAVALLDGIQQPKVTVLVGPGNNGGDGLVVGRVIAQQIPDAQVRFYLLSRRDEAKDSVFASAQSAGLFMAYSEDDRDHRVLRNMVASADLIVDALLGIGAKPPLKQPVQRILRSVRQAVEERRSASRLRTRTIDPTAPNQIEYPPRQIILAIDCPSGLDCDTGEIDSTVLHAEETVTFIAAKPGVLMFPGAAAVGKLRIAPLEMPEGFTLPESKVQLLDHAGIAALLPPRAPDSHKGTFGKVMVIAGSGNYTGAALLSSRAAYRSGAGLVTVGVPAPVAGALAGQLLEATWLLLAHDLGVLSANAAETIHKEIEGYKSLLIGPGLGTESTTLELIRRLFTRKPAQSKRDMGFGVSTAEGTSDSQTEITLPPTVIDADGLNLLSKIEEWWKLLPAETVLTPHPAEMGRLSQLSTDEVQAQRLDLARAKAEEWNAVVILKGAMTVIAAPDGRLTLSPFKTDALATAGTGDVLAGLIAGLLAQGLKPFDAAQSAVYIHGLAGVKAAEQFGSGQHPSGRSVLAGDVLDHITEAFRDFA